NQCTSSPSPPQQRNQTERLQASCRQWLQWQEQPLAASRCAAWRTAKGLLQSGAITPFTAGYVTFCAVVSGRGISKAIKHSVYVVSFDLYCAVIGKRY